MKPEIENLKAHMRFVKLNSYQKGLALDEFYKLIDYVTELEKLSQPLISGSTGSERIICAAVWYKEIPIKKEIPFESTNPKNCPTGLVFSGHRHGQCIYTKCAVTGLPDAKSGENEQGFLTSKNRFVSREEALIIALRENQVMDIKEIRGNRLFSEDLY
jgi:hypothetical protein